MKATINGKSLAQMVGKTQFAITSEDALLSEWRPVRPETGRMTFVATDGHRLALVNVKHDGNKGDDIKAILPRKTLG